MGPQGSQYISREFTFLRGGRVKVKVIKSYPDPAKLGKEYSFDCRLFDEQQGYGAVKITIDAMSKHYRASGYRSMALAVDQGHDLNVIVDLSRCEASRKKPAIIIGSQITDYDVVNGGKTLEVFLPLPVMTGEQRIQGEGFIAQFLKNGDVAIMKIGSPRPSLIDQLRVGPAFNCKLSTQNAVHTNDVNENSVKVFYNK
ncbi:unnamed protein product [Lymnaea stagnalis]|uniref:Uncharacterized protein n=1 Tax=Lymnaea stagnalis TaxID=6523 RepID=A0AAV2HA85_LYMST